MRKSKPNKKKRYSASERRSFWIGVGFGLNSDSRDSNKLFENFKRSLSDKDITSFINGLVLNDGKLDFSKYDKKGVRKGNV